MQKISTKDLLSLENYSQEREKIRKNLIEIKKDRKIQIGGNVTLLFENNATIKYQIQEMLRVEKIFEEDGIKEELAAYNPLIPDGNNLKATMLIEFPDAEERKEKLSYLIGIEDKVWLQIGENERIFGIADEDLERSDEEKTSAVHFLRFELSNLMIKDLKSKVTLFAGISHPNYNVRTQEIAQSISNSLSKDLD
tara:strand:+ start:575 stop:1159 length:585 start_codon:yes stop_codon:yes gene_type:complete